MIILNCSRAAIEHLFKNAKKGNDLLKIPNNQTVAETQAEYAQNNQPCWQWVVHAIKVGRSTCLIAMEYETRYCHVIHKVKKGDTDDFIIRLHQRLLAGIDWLLEGYALVEPQERSNGAARFHEQHTDHRFYLRSDRSVMTHINQVSYIYGDTCAEKGCLPPDELTALSFDLRLNEDFRVPKGEEMGRFNYEKMLGYWLSRYHSFTPQQLEEASEKIRIENGKTWDLHWEEPDVSNESNVIDFIQYKKLH